MDGVQLKLLSMNRHHENLDNFFYKLFVFCLVFPKAYSSRCISLLSLSLFIRFVNSFLNAVIRSENSFYSVLVINMNNSIHSHTDFNV